MSFGGQLLRRRRELNLTLSALAKSVERAGVKVSIATLSRIEGGHREPSLALKVALAATLGLDLELPEQTLVEDGEEGAMAAAVGGRIRERRREVGLTQGELAAKMVALGDTIDSSAISRYETGQVLPGVARIVTLAIALETTTDTILLDGERRGEEEALLAAYRAGGLAGVLRWCSEVAGGGV